MPYIQKFNYVPLSRETVDGKRKYATPDGNKLPSVTTILDATKPEETRRALLNWQKSVGVERARAITTEAANRGTRMHSYLEHYVKTGDIQPRGSNPYSWASHRMASEVITQGLSKVNEFWGIEVPLYFPGVYAGTTDCVGIHQDAESILDFKQSNRPKKREWIEDYFLQLVFYGTAHNELHGTKIKKGVILMCVKPSLNEQLEPISQPEYLEFILEGEEWKIYESKMWNRLEQYYRYHS
jgi:genome maintenance exonuclease 1